MLVAAVDFGPSYCRVRGYGIKDSSLDLTFRLESPGNGVACAPDGRVAAITCEDGSLILMHLRSFQRAGVMWSKKAAPRTPVFSRDGRYLAAACGEKTLSVWDVDGWSRELHRFERL